jgi:hypothetical protein
MIEVTGKKARFYVFNTETNEQMILAEANDIQIIDDFLGDEQIFNYELKSVRFNFDIFMVMQRQYNSYNYRPTKTHKFILNFVVADTDGVLQKMQLIDCSPISSVEMVLKFEQQTLCKKWSGTAKRLCANDVL